MKEFWSNLKFTWKYAKDQKIVLVKFILFCTLSILISILVPILGARQIVLLTDNQFYQLIFVSIVIYVVEMIRNFVHYFNRRYTQLIYRETFTKLQTDLGKELLKLENSCIDSNSSGVFIQRITNDTSKIADMFNKIAFSLMDIIIDIGIFTAIFIVNKIAFVFYIVEVIVIYFIENKRVNLVNEKDKLVRKKRDKISGFVGEIVRGIRDIKMLNAEESFINELHDKVVDLNTTSYEMRSIDRKYILIRGSFTDLFDLLGIILLVSLIIRGNLTIASAIVIHNYSGKIVYFMTLFGELYEHVKDFNLSSSRVFSIINSDEFTKEKFGKKHLDSVEGNFEFKNVSFMYNKEEGKILDNLSFKINANETVAFVGKSGAGKSTIFSLLCKMYDVDSGTITIDGIDIKKLDKDSIRGNITIISQNPYIFNVSIRDNFRLVKENMTDEEMYEACRLACLDDFIETLPDKYDTVIGEGGVNLSGGQKQRLAIARALVQKTEIILFDEATSALDNETQKSIQKAINNMQGEYTILIIAHRLSTIIDSDRILFLDDGAIVAEGTHEELLKKCDAYKLLYEAEIQDK